MTTPLPHQPPAPEWVARIRAGDEAAFEALFRALAPGLCAAGARLVGSRQVAEELVQELFFDVWSKRESLVVIDSLPAYFRSAVRNRALNHLRRERRLARWATDDPAPPVQSIDAAAPDESALLDALEVQDAIDSLPPRCRLIFTLNRQQDLTYGEIAASLGLSIKTVETQMGRALHALRIRLRHLLQ
jgi:RNA polymerase sigma-70 factor, ECF subfamily